MSATARHLLLAQAEIVARMRALPAEARRDRHRALEELGRELQRLEGVALDFEEVLDEITDPSGGHW